MNFGEFYREATESDVPTKEMIKYFDDRTNKHIALVQKYAAKIEPIDPAFKGLTEVAKLHDASKFEDDERIPYIFNTWNYYCTDNNISFELSDDMKDKIADATYHHLKHNPHHVDFYNDNEDATKMPDLYLGEQLADWFAMSEERNNKVRDWADDNVNKKWKYTPKQVSLIYKVINKLER